MGVGECNEFKRFSLLLIAVMKEAFRYFDKDGDGEITINDFRLGSEELGKKLCKDIFDFFFNSLLDFMY